MASSASSASASTSAKVSFGEVARLAAAHARVAAARLSAKKRWDDDDIHATRVLCKKLRAVVHLGRGQIPKKSRRRWNERLQKAAKSLSGARDAVILRGWIEAAAAHADAEIVRAIPGIVARLDGVYHRRLPVGARAVVLGTLRALAREWPVKWGGIDAPPRQGLARMRSRVHQAAEDALDGGKAEAWHVWRRRVKYAAYQLEWIALARQKKPSARYRNLRALGSALGKLNDMHNLQTWIATTRLRSRATRYLSAWAEAAGKSWTRKARAAWKKADGKSS